METSTKLHMRATADQKRKLAAAADLQHKTLTGFVMGVAEAAADRVIIEHSTTVVPADYFDALYASLDTPPQPNEALAAVAARPRRVVRR